MINIFIGAALFVLALANIFIGMGQGKQRAKYDTVYVRIPAGKLVGADVINVSCEDKLLTVGYTKNGRSFEVHHEPRRANE